MADHVDLYDFVQPFYPSNELYGSTLGNNYASFKMYEIFANVIAELNVFLSFRPASRNLCFAPLS